MWGWLLLVEFPRQLFPDACEATLHVGPALDHLSVHAACTTTSVGKTTGKPALRTGNRHQVTAPCQNLIVLIYGNLCDHAHAYTSTTQATIVLSSTTLQSRRTRTHTKETQTTEKRTETHNEYAPKTAVLGSKHTWQGQINRDAAHQDPFGPELRSDRVVRCTVVPWKQRWWHMERVYHEVE